jgi:hypothetical protein
MWTLSWTLRQSQCTRIIFKVNYIPSLSLGVTFYDQAGNHYLNKLKSP